MATLKCKSCGAPLNVTQEEQLVQCEYCDLTQTLPQLDDDFKLQMFDQANERRRRFEFDSAKALLQAIIAQYPQEAEAYWQICLCKYGVMYVEDQNTLARIPTFYRMIPQSILSDEDYLKALEYANASAWKYEEEANKLDKLQKKILELSNNEEPYDIFICYKKTDLDNGGLTQDSQIASRIYMNLIENNYRVFWAERSLPTGCEYEPYIYAALSTAKVMLVISTDERHFEAEWVKNEWIRFLDMMTRSSDKTIFTCYKNMPVENIPTQLRNLQALDMSDMMFSSKLLEDIQKKLPKKSKEVDTNALINAFKSVQSAASPNNIPSASEKELQLENGIYRGEAIAGNPHGYGICYYSDSARYEGEWNVGKRHGQGTYYYPDGSTLSGEWSMDIILNGNGYAFLDGMSSGFTGEYRNGKPWSGKGCFTMPDDNNIIFDGQWENGLPNGEGTFTYTDKEDYLEGTFENGFNGNVKWHFADGRCYIGDLKNGNCFGIGKMLRNDGSIIYEGDYIDGSPNGKGIQYYNDGDRYEGEFKDANHHGYGIYYFSDGRRYEGEWYDDKKHGQGTLYLLNGSWSGEWKDSNRWNGEGMILYYGENGNPNRIFTGTVKDGHLCGYGKMAYEDGTVIYEGEYENGSPNGKGTEYYNNGNYYEGMFKNGSREGYGIYYYSTGNRYEGEWINGSRQGQGTFYYPTGSWSGEWNNSSHWNGCGLIIYYYDNNQPTGKYYEGHIVNGTYGGTGKLTLPDGSWFEGEFYNGSYFNGKLHIPGKWLPERYVNGKRK